MEYYETLLEECSYLQIDHEATLKIMKENLKQLGGKK